MNLEDYAKSTLHMYKHYSGGVVSNAEMASKLAEILIARFYGEAEVSAQRPLKVRANGDQWIVEGSQEKDRMDPIAGPVTLILSKLDAQVIGVVKAANLPATPSIAPGSQGEPPKRK